MSDQCEAQPSQTASVRLQTPTEREQAFLQVLEGEVRADSTDVFIDMNKLRAFASQGVPERLRPRYWRILLNYLPPGPLSEWPAILARSRKMYADFLADLLSRPEEQQKQSSACSSASLSLAGESCDQSEPAVDGDGSGASDETAERTEPAVEDHPLSDATTSRWNRYFKDKDMQAEIDKDVRRTFPHLHFFNQDGAAGETKHHQALRRILFIYAKLNPGINYVQGMNEVLGPIYYVFAADSHHPDDSAHAEADAFFCFTNLMSEIMNHFCKTLDSSDMGIRASILKLNRMLRHYDHGLWQDLEDKGLDPHFYSFRWITLLLSQEFELPDVIRLWDSLFADAARFDFLLKVCCAMLIAVRKQILDNDFATNLKCLQAYPSPDIIALIRRAEQLDHQQTPHVADQHTPALQQVEQPPRRQPSAASLGPAPPPPPLQQPAPPPPADLVSETADAFAQVFENLRNAFFF